MEVPVRDDARESVDATDAEKLPATLRLLEAGTARMASAAGLRQVLSLGMLAVTAAVVARCLGPRDFGVYSAGTAAFSLANSVTDLGFSLFLSREMSKRAQDEESLMGTALPAQVLWTLVPAFGLLVLGVIAGGSRGAVMIVLVPAVLLSGFAVTRQIFGVRFVASPLIILDVSTTVLQCLIMVGLALAHAPLIALAINLCVWSVIVGVTSLLLARRLVGFKRPGRSAVLAFIRGALPLGIASVLASLYFTIDMTILGWLVSPHQLGNYAAAVRLLNIVVMVPGFIMAAGIPGLSRMGDDSVGLSRFASSLAHWIAVTALPVGVFIAIFARPIVEIMFGSAYLGAVPLIRILMLASLLSFLSNITGIVMMTQGIVGPQILFNAISLVVNVLGNVLLVPKHGVIVSAWLTVVSEGIVVSYGVVTLRKKLDYGIVGSTLWRPLLAIAVAAGVGLMLGGSSVLAVLGATAAFLVGMTVIRAWPMVLTSWFVAKFGRLPSSG